MIAAFDRTVPWKKEQETQQINFKDTFAFMVLLFYHKERPSYEFLISTYHAPK